MEIEIGKWYYASYGYDTVVGKCVGAGSTGNYILEFRWGGPFREPNAVREGAIHSEAEDPRLLSKLIRMCATLYTRLKNCIE